MKFNVVKVQWLRKLPHAYTHRDNHGMLWRFEGSRPVSELADHVMAQTERKRLATVAKRKKATR